MGTNWSEERTAQYRARHPAVDRSEQKRLAQRRYRARHAKRLEQVRTITNILMRQTSHAGDMKLLAKALRAGLTRDGIATLRTLLR